jgi:DNA-binding transcriptional ArsR family regulator
MKSTATPKAILKQCDYVSDILKSLSHPVRLKILCQLMQGEKSVNELIEFCEISQSNMSQFLKRMKEEGVVSSRREWNKIFYSVADPRLLKLLEAIKEIYT